MNSLYDMVDMFFAVLPETSRDEFSTKISLLLSFVTKPIEGGSLTDDQLRMAFSDWTGHNLTNDVIATFRPLCGGNGMVVQMMIRVFFYAKLVGYRFDADGLFH